MSDGYRRPVGEKKTYMSVIFELPRATENCVARYQTVIIYRD